MRRVVGAAALAFAFLFASAGGAAACATYCDWDPLVLAVTPAGHLILMYDSVWTSNLLQVGLPTETTTTERVWHGITPETKVSVTIYVPTGLLFKFPTYDAVTTGLLGSGTVLASGTGTSGTPVTLTFVLATP